MSILISLALAAAPVRVLPVDQCTGDPSFVAARARFQQLVRRRDVAALKAMLASDVMVSFGGDNGRAVFIQQWKLDGPAVSPLWAELDRILPLGCASVEAGRVIPAMAMTFPGEDEALFEQSVVTDGPAVLRARPSDRAAAIANVGWQVVTPGTAAMAARWVRVRTGDGRRGYLKREQLRSPIDYRAVFELRGGKWTLAAFVAGD